MLTLDGGIRFGVGFQYGVKANEVAQDPQLANPLALEAEQRGALPLYRAPGGSITPEGAHVDAGESHSRERLLALGHAFEYLAAIVSEGGSDA